ncbi:MAG: class I SAM-dependent methyltransferase [Limisphaerales bacterium]
MGSGTGISSELFLQNGNVVFGIEPNQEMRSAAERLLSKYGSRFNSIPATAEATTLGEQSCDFVIAGQAFHWFDRVASRKEFKRILKPSGYVVLIWNERKTGATPFLQAYEELLLRFGTDYQQVNHTNIDETVISQFFNPGPFQFRTFPNAQQFDFTGLKGRLLSSSYAPAVGQPNHEPMLQQLRAIFDRYQSQGVVSFDYDTKVYFGRPE